MNEIVHTWILDLELATQLRIAETELPASHRSEDVKRGLHPAGLKVEVVRAGGGRITFKATLEKTFPFDVDARFDGGETFPQLWRRARQFIAPSADANKAFEYVCVEPRMYLAVVDQLKTFAGHADDAEMLMTLTGQRQADIVKRFVLKVAEHEVPVKHGLHFASGLIAPSGSNHEPSRAEVEGWLQRPRCGHEVFSRSAQEALVQERYGDVITNLMAMLEIVAKRALAHAQLPVPKNVKVDGVWGGKNNVPPKLKRRIGRFFLDSSPEDYRWLQDLERCRNGWLHNGAYAIRDNHRASTPEASTPSERPLERSDAIEMCRSAHRAATWLLYELDFWSDKKDIIRGP